MVFKNQFDGLYEPRFFALTPLVRLIIFSHEGFAKGQISFANTLATLLMIFTIQEAKGPEYENIILYNFLSQEESRYRSWLPPGWATLK